MSEQSVKTYKVPVLCTMVKSGSADVWSCGCR